MPIKAMSFGGQSGRDIHLLRSQTSRSLIAQGNLGFDDDTPTGAWAGDYLGTHFDVALEFRPVFEAVDMGTHYDGFGISVDKKTGAVSIPGLTSPDTPQNFLIEAVCTKNDGGLAIAPVPIQVHLHNSVKSVWVTPSKLTVRRTVASGEETTRYRFTVRAQFDDDTVGDVTLNHGVTWSSPAVNSDGFIVIPGGAAAGSTIPVTAKVPVAWGTQSAAASIAVGVHWGSDANLPRAELVDGPPSTWGTTANVTNAPNVLLFMQGFTQPDLAKVDLLNAGFMRGLKADPITIPFDRLADSINYWSVAPEAPVRGVSVRCEIYIINSLDLETNKVSEVTLPVPRPAPPKPAGPWTLENLIYMVGLPLPSDGPETQTETNLRVRWSKTLRRSPGAQPPLDQISFGVVRAWQDMASRTFCDEIDTFPALTRGGPPSASAQFDLFAVNVDDERGGQEEIDAFLAVLQPAVSVTMPAGIPFGSIWTTDGPEFRFDNRGLFVFLSNAYGRGHAEDRFISIPLYRSRYYLHVAGEKDRREILALPHVRIPTRNAVAINQQSLAITGDEHRTIFRIVAHELGHEFRLGDEYIEFAKVFAGAEDDLVWYSNLTSEAKVRSSGGTINSKNIKWNWERIQKAAVIAGPIDSPGGGVYSVPILAPQGKSFASGEVVRIRKRTWRVNLNHAPPVIGDFTVVSVSAVGDRMQIRETAPPTTGFQISDFGDGSVIYVPVPAPSSVQSAAYPYARMIAPVMEKYMDTNNRALTPMPCDPDFELQRHLEDDVQMPDEAAVDAIQSLFWSRRNVSRLVGLYSGGDRFACGVFHPAGWCLMNNSSPTPKTAQEFCPVCRYALVDFVDPSKHDSIDKLYAQIYPE